MFGTGEMLIIALVAIIVVDPKKLPDLMVTRHRAPARVAPPETSRATFSFTEYSKVYAPSGERRKKVSGTSEEGVPG